jgi:hypothetical protein
MTGVNIAISRSMFNHGKGLTLMGSAGQTRELAVRLATTLEGAPQVEQAHLRVGGAIDQAISFIHTDLPDPGVPMIAPLKF